MIATGYPSIRHRLPPALFLEAERLTAKTMGPDRAGCRPVDRKKALRANMALVRLFLPRHRDPETQRRAQRTINNLQEQL